MTRLSEARTVAHHHSDRLRKCQDAKRVLVDTLVRGFHANIANNW